MPSRIGHRKSRHGCAQCKQRRVKCSEDIPCQHCVRRKEKCSLIEEAALQSKTPNGLSPGEDSGTSRSSSTDPLAFLQPTRWNYDPDLAFVQADWIQDMHLMHHFCTSGASALAYGKNIGFVWRDYIPKIAIQHQYLMHGLLAVAAAHLRWMEPYNRAKWNILCSHHQALALPPFRQALQQLSRENCEAAFSMAALCSTMRMAAFSIGGDDDDRVPTLEDLAEQFTLTRSVRDCLHPMWETLTASPMALMMRGASMENYEVVSLSVEMKAQFQKIVKLIERYSTDEASKALYMEALSDLERVYKDVIFHKTDDVNEMGIVVKWTMVPGRFVDAMIRREVPALILVANWVITMGWAQRWFLQGWSRKAWDVTIAELPKTPDIMECLAWPKRQLEEGLPAFPPQA
ncbi:hypothetical protein BT63DRAFT_428070 [Microthyrium microscopicum]|uniref:Zn(2)-C6 fungal-type domain-containing protein n=1 Tax=Microthyrium microscopicum TaxID=703497 RepID=A0A6A6U4U0_9PEZI|nr:hypothetical protein BT63DRAFT_428070 [Microthyrium microscopicum]